LDGGSARRKAFTYTGQHNIEKSAHTTMPRTSWLLGPASALFCQNSRTQKRDVVTSLSSKENSPTTHAVFSTQMFQTYEGVSKSFRTGRLKRELKMVQLSATRCSCVAIFRVNLLSSVAISLCVDSQLMFIVVYSVIDVVRKLLDTHSYHNLNMKVMGSRYRNSRD